MSKPSKRMSDEQRTRIQKLLKEGKVELASTEALDSHSEQLKELLDVVNPGWRDQKFLITDESSLSEYLWKLASDRDLDGLPEDEERGLLVAWAEQLRIPLRRDMLLSEILILLKARG